MLQKKRPWQYFYFITLCLKYTTTYTKIYPNTLKNSYYIMLCKYQFRLTTTLNDISADNFSLTSFFITRNYFLEITDWL